jgi:hypothetical protein
MGGRCVVVVVPIVVVVIVDAGRSWCGLKPALYIPYDESVIDARKGLCFPENLLFVIFWMQLDLFCSMSVLLLARGATRQNQFTN